MAIVRRMATFIVFAGITTYIALHILGAVVNAQVEKDLNTIVIRDRLGAGVHNISGMVMVPSECHTVDVKSRSLDVANYMLEFQTWENPSLPCSREQAARQFHLTLFAPAVGVTLQAELDGAPTPLVVISTIQ